MQEIFRDPPLDAVVVSGHQINLARSIGLVPKPNGKITVETQLITHAAGELFVAGFAKELILPTGYTEGPNYPSEAELIANELTLKYPHIPSSAKILKPLALDTRGDVLTSIGVIKKRGHKKVGILSLGKHVKNVAKLYKHYKFPVNQRGVFVAEEIIYLTRKSHDPKGAEEFIKDFRYFTLLSGINLRETLRSILLATVDRGGSLLWQITKRTRG